MSNDEHNQEVYIPSARAFAFTGFVLLFCCAVLAIAGLEISQSPFWQHAPTILQRALEPKR